MVAIYRLATRHEVDLDGFLRDRYHVCQVFELRESEASELLVELRAMTTSIDENVDTVAE